MDSMVDNRKMLIAAASFLFFTLENVVSNDLDRCPNNLPKNEYLKAFQGKCYEFHNMEKSWHAAHDFCTGRGGWLLQVFDWPTQSFIHNSLRALNWNRNGVWLGAHDIDYEGQWKWVQGQPMAFSNWAEGQPGGCQAIIFCLEDCANIRLDDNGLWHDYPCDIEPFSFICEYDMQPLMTTTPSTAMPSTTTATPATPSTTTPSTTSATTNRPTTLDAFTSPSPTFPSTTVVSSSTFSVSVPINISSTLKSSTSVPVTVPHQSTVQSTSTLTSTSVPVANTEQSLQPDENIQSGLSHGQVAALAITLLIIAFLAGAVCTFLFIRKHRRTKREEHPNQVPVRYVIDPSRQPRIDESRLVLNMLYSTPDSPPKYDEIDHSSKMNPMNMRTADPQSNMKFQQGVCHTDMLQSYNLPNNDSCREKAEFIEYDFADEHFVSKRSSCEKVEKGCSGEVLRVDLPAESKSKLRGDQAVYETPGDSNILYRKVNKRKDQDYERESQHGHNSNAEYDDATFIRSRSESLSNVQLSEEYVDDENVYCDMQEVDMIKHEMECFEDSVYEEPISIKHLTLQKDSELKQRMGLDTIAKDLNEAMSEKRTKESEQTHTSLVCDDVITMKSEEYEKNNDREDYLMACADVERDDITVYNIETEDVIQGIDNPTYSE